MNEYDFEIVLAGEHDLDAVTDALFYLDCTVSERDGKTIVRLTRHARYIHKAVEGVCLDFHLIGLKIRGVRVDLLQCPHESSGR